MTNAYERQQTAKAIRFMRKILQNRSLPDIEQDKPSLLNRWIFALLITALVLLGSCRVCHAQEFSDVQIVNAIFLAEGGYHAEYPYGIRSMACDSARSCRQICLNTVKNNKKRFSRRHERGQSFIAFLGSKYCPIGANNDTGTNKFWVKNVEYFLKEGI